MCVCVREGGVCVCERGWGVCVCVREGGVCVREGNDAGILLATPMLADFVLCQTAPTGQLVVTHVLGGISHFNLRQTRRVLKWERKRGKGGRRWGGMEEGRWDGGRNGGKEGRGGRDVRKEGRMWGEREGGREGGRWGGVGSGREAGMEGRSGGRDVGREGGRWGGVGEGEERIGDRTATTNPLIRLLDLTLAALHLRWWCRPAVEYC